MAMDIQRSIELMDRLSNRNILNEEEKRTAQKEIARLRVETEGVLEKSAVPQALARLKAGQRATYQNVFALIYECPIPL